MTLISIYLADSEDIPTKLIVIGVVVILSIIASIRSAIKKGASQLPPVNRSLPPTVRSAFASRPVGATPSLPARLPGPPPPRPPRPRKLKAAALVPPPRPPVSAPKADAFPETRQSVEITPSQPVNTPAPVWKDLFSKPAAREAIILGEVLDTPASMRD